MVYNGSLTTFYGVRKKPRIMMALLQQGINEGGVTLPDIDSYYNAAVLENMLQ